MCYKTIFKNVEYFCNKKNIKDTSLKFSKLRVTLSQSSPDGTPLGIQDCTSLLTTSALKSKPSPVTKIKCKKILVPFSKAYHLINLAPGS